MQPAAQDYMVLQQKKSIWCTWRYLARKTLASSFPFLQVHVRRDSLANDLMEYNYNAGIMKPLVVEMAIWI